MFDFSQLYGRKAERSCCSFLWLSLLSLRLVVVSTWVMATFEKAAECSAVIKEDRKLVMIRQFEGWFNFLFPFSCVSMLESPLLPRALGATDTGSLWSGSSHCPLNTQEFLSWV